MRSEPNKPWANLPIQVSVEVASLISVAVTTEVGNGSSTLFWKDKWLDGRSIKDIAPLVYALVPKRKSSKHTVLDALTGEKWNRGCAGCDWLCWPGSVFSPLGYLGWCGIE
jgi:hypothetical protein